VAKAGGLDALKAEFPMLRVIRHRVSCGQSRAVTTGVSAARYEWIATLDGDGQNDPADIPRLLATLDAGYDVVTDAPNPNAVKAKEERIEREGKEVHVYMTSVRSHFTPDIIRVKKGDNVHLHITNVEQAHDATHGFTIGSYNVHSSLEPGKHVDITFLADKEGTFPFYCTEFCSALHLEMAGYLLVEPS